MAWFMTEAGRWQDPPAAASRSVMRRGPAAVASCCGVPKAPCLQIRSSSWALSVCFFCFVVFKFFSPYVGSKSCSFFFFLLLTVTVFI